MSDILHEKLGKLQGGRILDLATGRGEFLLRLCDCFTDHDEAIGVDVEERIVQVARELCAEHKLHDCRFLAMNGASLDFKNASFDTVAISNSLHHLVNPFGTLAEMHRVLKPGGLFILSEMYSDDQDPRQQMHVDFHHWWADIDTRLGVPHFHTFERAEILAQLSSLAFASREDLDQIWPSPDQSSREDLEQLAERSDRILARASGHADHEELKRRGEELKERLFSTGWASAKALVFLGRK